MEPVADMCCSATQVENRTVLQTSSFESYGGFFAALLASYVSFLTSVKMYAITRLSLNRWCNWLFHLNVF